MDLFASVLCLLSYGANVFASGPLDSEIGTDPSLPVPLEDDSSRADLFRQVVDQKQRAQHTPMPDSTMDQLNPFDLRGQSGSFMFPRDAIYDVSQAKPRTNSIFGIDISHHTNPDIPFRALQESKVAFLYAKATQGITFKDSLFSMFWKTLDELPPKYKIHRGAYHFLTANEDAATQAGTFLKFLSANGGLKPTDMPPVLDLEWETYKRKPIDLWKGHDPDRIVQKAVTWLTIVKQKTGRTPILYTSYSWWRERGIQDKRLFAELDKGHYKIWIADYSDFARSLEVPAVPPNTPWILWQFTDRARLPQNYKHGVDATIFNGLSTKFYQDFGVANFSDAQ